MGIPPGSHLSDEEVGRAPRIEGEGPARDGSPPTDPEIVDHLQLCAYCRERVRRAQVTEPRAESTTSSSDLTSTGCPPDTTWSLLIANVLSRRDAARHTRHASECESCGRLLREAIRDSRAPATPDELRKYEESVVSSPEWQHQMARTLAANVQIRRQQDRRARFRFLSVAAVAFVCAGVFAAWQLQRGRSEDPDRLLAEAYTERRTLEMRFPGAAHASLRMTRGEGSTGTRPSQLERPKPLIEAEAEIVRGLSREPDNASWLQSKGRADLLAWNYEAAMRAFRRALEIRPNTPDLLTDLASAYFERAEAASREMDYGVALDLLGRALQQAPDDPVALFNRAVVAGHLRLYNQAIRDLERLLILEPTGGWAGEARARLQQLRSERDRSIDQRPLPQKPSAFLQQLDQESFPGSLDRRSDELLETAILSWIPDAIGGSAEARRALDVAAERLVGRNNDLWLRDLLQGNLAEQEAMLALRDAVAANVAGDPLAADRSARRAASLFEVSHNVAGAYRARVELVYSAHRLVEPERCLMLAAEIKDVLSTRRYAWAEAQLWIEDSICATMQGDFSQASASINRGITLARAARYDTLSLRAVGIKAALQNTLGNTSAAWSENLSGLRLYWAGAFPPQRAYQFYADMAFAAQRHERWHLATSIAEEAVWAIERTPNRSTQAMAWHRLGTLARQASLNDAAVRAFQRAHWVFESLPSDDAIRRYRIDCSINLAFLEASVSDVREGLRELEAVREEVAGISDINVVLRYHYTLGMLHLRDGNAPAAEASFRLAATSSEKAFRSLKTDRDRDAWEVETEKIYRGLVELLVGSGNPTEAYHLWRRFRSARSDRDDSVDRTAGLPPGEALITYAQITDGVALWAATDRGVVSGVSRVAPSELERLIRRFAAECADPDASVATLRRDGRELHRLLIEPIASQIPPGGRLIVEPDAALWDVPFQALVDSTGQPLARNHEMVVLVGSRAERTVDWRTSPISPTGLALVVGAPAVPAELSSSFPPLPHALEEARHVAALFKRSLLLTGADATLPTITQQLPLASLFHFAGHAARGVEGGALVVAADRSGPMLGPRQLESTQLRQCRLAVLSACGTGARSDDERFPRLGLVRRFVRAGVPQVLATRWDIDSAAAAAFMQPFYASLGSSHSAASALRHAISIMIDAPATAHPYYWAAFALYVVN